MIRLKLSKTNCYIIETENGLMMIDTGYDFDWDLLYKELNRNIVDIRHIRFIFLTHHHDDHSGNLNKLTELNPELQVIMNEKCVGLLTKGENAREYGGGWCSKGMKRLAELYRTVKKQWSLSFPPYFIRSRDIALTCEDASISEIVGLPYRAVYTPGHSIDSISLLDDKGNLFCGDAVARYLLWAGTKYAPAFITDVGEFYRSWEKILGLGVKTIYPAHGNAFKPAMLRKYIGRITNESMGEFLWD